MSGAPRPLEATTFSARLARLLHGPPPALPGAMDRLCERWAYTPPRARLAVLLAAVLVVLAIAGRGAVRSPWGGPSPVLVARSDLPAGHVLQPADLAASTWPSRLVPAGSPSEASRVAGTPLAMGLPAGGLLTSTHLAVAGVAAGLPVGHVAVSLKVPDGLALASGQHVDLMTLERGGGGVLLASDATVLAVEGERVWVVVRRHEAP
ncbi:MAG: SAF domain-containing protein, partial [Actinomycetota bacterium]|nr:SAF domain-containing protein [Actinomycetota bacterium]